MLQKRDVAITVVLCIVTCGIYMLWWYYQTINALDQEGQSSNLEPIVQFVLMFLYVGGFLFGINADANINAIKAKRGIPTTDNKVLWLILAIVPFAQVAIIQSEINKLAA